MTLSWACLCLGSILSFAMLYQIVPWTIETILCITSVIRPRLQFFEMGVSLVSVCILLWDILHASFGEGADLSDVFMRSILCWCCSVSFYLFFLCHLFFVSHRLLRLLEGLLAPGCAKKALGHFHTFFRWKVEAATDRKRKSSPVNAIIHASFH